MKKMLNFKKLIIIVCTVSAIVTGARASVIGRRTSLQAGANANADSALLQQFTLLCKKMYDITGDYTLSGNITINDGADPSAKMDHVGFVFCKQGKEFYYQLGKTVTLNEQGAYLYIDYQARQIMHMQQKEVLYDAGFKQFGGLGAQLRSENYQISSKISGDEQTISLINEHHISCKEYALSFERQGMKIRSLYIRLNNLNDPLNKAKEKTVRVNITQWDHTADLGKYLSKNDIIQHVNSGWKAVGMFKGYRLINM